MLKLLKKKIKRDEDDADMDQDEFESLQSIYGVICAFLLAIAMSAQDNVTYANLQYATFSAAVYKQQGFRTFVHQVLNSTEGGYNFTFPIGPGEWIDTEHELLAGVVARFPWQEATPHVSTGRWDDKTPDLIAYEPLRLIPPLLYPDWDSRYTEAYLISHPGAYRPAKQGYISYVSAAGTSLLISGLCTNIVLYVAFLVSPAREDETGEASRVFKQIALPITYFHYATLIISVGCMSYANAYRLCWETPFQAYDSYVNGYWTNAMAYAPPCFIFLPLSVIAYFRSKWTGRRARRSSRLSGMGLPATTTVTPLEGQQQPGGVLTVNANGETSEEKL